MIEINLLPEELKKSQARFKKIDISGLNLQELPVLKIIAALIVVLIVVQVILFFIGAYSKSQLASLSKKYNEILPSKKEADALKIQVDTINRKMAAIEELMVKRFSWSKKLNDMADSVTPGIWLTELTYDEKLTDREVKTALKPADARTRQLPPKTVVERVVLRYLIISGYAAQTTGEEGTAAVGKFIKGLKDNVQFYSDFSDIELGSIRRDKVEDQEVMNFRLTCLFKEPK